VLFVFAHPFFFLSTGLCLTALAAYFTYAIRRPKGASLVLPTVALGVGFLFIFYFTYVMVALTPYLQELPSVS
jgi:hypothetical protein